MEHLPHHLPIERIFESSLNPRKHYNEAKMEELIESIRVKGIMMPLLVRPIRIDPGTIPNFEIAAGHRRYRAAKKLKLAEVPVIVREMIDKDFLEILTFENLMHEDVEPLDEAQGYRTLIEKAGHDVASIAAKLGKGKSESYIYQRLKLLELIPEAKQLLTNGKMTAGHAILIARLQPDEQKRLLKEGLYSRWGDHELVGVRDLAHYIEQNIHLDLNGASFSKSDPGLVPEAGPCTTCPKRTGFSTALFPDIKKKDTCTDPKCFAKKNQAFIDSWIQEKVGRPVVDKKGHPLKIEPPLRLSGDYNYDKKKVSGVIPSNLYMQVKKDSCKSAREGIITGGQNKGMIMTVCADPQCKTHRPRRVNSAMDDKWRAQRKAEDTKRKQTILVRVKTVDTILSKVPGELSKEDLAFVAGQLYDELWNEFQKKMLARHDLKPTKVQYGQDMHSPMNAYIRKCGKAELNRLLMEMALIRNTESQYGGSLGKDALLAVAERYKVNPKSIEKEIKMQTSAKKKPQKKGVKGRKNG